MLRCVGEENMTCASSFFCSQYCRVGPGAWRCVEVVPAGGRLPIPIPTPCICSARLTATISYTTALRVRLLLLALDHSSGDEDGIRRIKASRLRFNMQPLTTQRDYVNSYYYVKVATDMVSTGWLALTARALGTCLVQATILYVLLKEETGVLGGVLPFVCTKNCCIMCSTPRVRGKSHCLLFFSSLASLSC